MLRAKELLASEVLTAKVHSLDKSAANCHSTTSFLALTNESKKVWNTSNKSYLSGSWSSLGAGYKDLSQKKADRDRYACTTPMQTRRISATWARTRNEERRVLKNKTRAKSRKPKWQQNFNLMCSSWWSAVPKLTKLNLTTWSKLLRTRFAMVLWKLSGASVSVQRGISWFMYLPVRTNSATLP